MLPLSPWTSGQTVVSAHPPSCPQIIPNHLSHHLNSQRNCSPDKDIFLMYDEIRVLIKLSWIRDFINSCHSLNYTNNDVTVTHLVLYIYYSQVTLLLRLFYVNEIRLLHSGMAYAFNLGDLPWNSPPLVAVLNRGSLFQCAISHSKSNPYRFFNLQLYMASHPGRHADAAARARGRLRWYRSTRSALKKITT